MFRRMILLFLTNILVMIALSTIGMFVMNYFGIQYGSYSGLMVMCFLFGMGGSFISLLISKWVAKRMMRLEEVPAGSSLVTKVHALARRSGLDQMPEVYIFNSPEINAFATGPSRNNSLVAVSTGLLERMNDDEAEAVLAHEVSHIANGDMVTMALVQGVANAIVMFVSSIVTNIVRNALSGDDEDDGGGIGGFFLHHLIYSVVYSVVSLLALPLIMSVSRWREYRADAGSARLVGKEKMINALKALQLNYDDLGKHDKNVAVMSISSKSSFAELFSSHPPLEKRINALKVLR